MFVVLGAGSLLFSCFGAAYAIPVFFPALGNSLAVPVPHMTALFSVTGALYFSFGVLSGPLADRVGARLTCATGSLVLAGGLAVISGTQSERCFAFGYVLGVGVGVGCVSCLRLARFKPIAERTLPLPAVLRLPGSDWAPSYCHH